MNHLQRFRTALVPFPLKHTANWVLFQKPRHSSEKPTNTESWAAKLVASCSPSEIEQLRNEILKHSSLTCTPSSDLTLSGEQRRLVFLASASPFIGFGFMDNFVMIIAGEYIDLTFATVFGFSTMAAAGLGNLVSDICGLGLVGYVEKYASLFGVKMPSLTPAELSSKSASRASNMGRLVGISVGCLLGMFPLLFIPRGSEKAPSNEASKEEEEEE
uniref:Transmembrane protein 65 n=1 Tax=Schistocephalus solidus TaxID=70667 RepID=A0A0X3NQB3_SCHSO